MSKTFIVPLSALYPETQSGVDPWVVGVNITDAPEWASEFHAASVLKGWASYQCPLFWVAGLGRDLPIYPGTSEFCRDTEILRGGQTAFRCAVDRVERLHERVDFFPFGDPVTLTWHETRRETWSTLLQLSTLWVLPGFHRTLSQVMKEELGYRPQVGKRSVQLRLICEGVHSERLGKDLAECVARAYRRDHDGSRGESGL